MTISDMKNIKTICKFNCIECNYKCLKKGDYNRHLLTNKHNLKTNDNKNNTQITSTEFVCNCGKKYKYRQGLSYHKIKCNYLENNEIKDSSNNQIILTNDLIIKLLNDNK